MHAPKKDGNGLAHSSRFTGRLAQPAKILREAVDDRQCEDLWDLVRVKFDQARAQALPHALPRLDEQCTWGSV